MGLFARLGKQVRELEPTASRVLDHDTAGQIEKARAFGLRQDLDERGDPPFELGFHALRDLPAGRRDADFDGTAVFRRRLATNEPARLRSVDETGDTRFIELEVARELVDAGGAIPQHSEQTRLDDREVVLRDDPTQGALNEERQLRQRIHYVQLPVVPAPGPRFPLAFALHGGSLLALVSNTNYIGSCHVLKQTRESLRAREIGMKMNAAVVTSFDEPPHYQVFDAPEPNGEHEVLADVLAVGLHPRVRSGASGSHYTSTDRLPIVPGIDGVARLPDGRRAYFVAPETAFGTMADKTVVDTRRVVMLPDDADAVKVAAAMNPAMSSWVALRCRVPLEADQHVLILGVTGNAGQMAVQVAKRLGAGRVVGVGRDPGRLREALELGADQVVALSDSPKLSAAAVAEAACEVDLVIDYLWGEPAQETIPALLMKRGDRSRSLNWIQIGSIAGPTIELPSVALRSANFRLQGNGQGAVSPRAYLAELPSLVDEITANRLKVNTVTVGLRDVEAAWTRPTAPGQRMVVVP
jgi:NADPH:quinone reductase-like Zn-dependent oxidoreductase